MWKRIRLTLEMIKFEHSVFALPFALTGALLAIRESGLGARAACIRIGWIVVAMVAARSAAMAFNRLIDAGIDARNPRTRMRHLPAGVLSPGFTWGFVAVSALVFLFAARQAEEAFHRIELIILAGVDDVEATGPEGDGRGEPEDARVERAAHRDPGGGRRNAQRESQDQVRERRKSFGE